VTRVAGYVLAGGESRRFGRDKARAVVDGKPLLLHAADLITEALGRAPVVVARRAGEYEDLGLVTIADETAGRGPLGGLARALAHAGDEHDAVLLSPCDWFGGEASWLRGLVDAWREGDGAVAYREGHWEPLPAVYGTGLLPRVETALESGDLSLAGLLTAVGARELPRPEDWGRATRIDRMSDLPD